MTTVISLCLTLGACWLALLCALLLLQALCARRTARPTPAGPRLAVAVIVPAHNESTHILPTLGDLKAQLRPQDRLLVVADNCTDDTAAVAGSAGAQVVERRDPQRRGKGYALDFGMRHLQARPPDIVMVVDADCRLAEEAIDQLALTCAASGRPVQALYLMTAPEGGDLRFQVAAFAWRVKNWLRPAGFAALGLPCQLMGTGMAFPWSTLKDAPLASGEIVEDLALGLDLARRGQGARFCPAARVTSEFAASAAGAGVQRQRWEQGHLSTILRRVPGLLWQAIARRDAALLALSLDLAVPPLSLLLLLTAAMVAASGVGALAGLSVVPLCISATAAAMATAALVIAWFTFGREVLPARALVSIAPYVLRKLGLYRRILTSRGASWIRTDRTK